MVKEFWRQAASQGDFLLGKFDVILDSFCSWPIGTLVDSMRRNPTGNGDRRRAGKF